MQLAMSNLAWDGDELDACLGLLSKLGCSGVELAASRVWPEPADTTAAQRSELQDKVSSQGLEIVGLHSLLYTRPDASLFGAPTQRRVLVDYLKSAADLCADLGGRTMVFGSVRARRRGELGYDAALSVAADAFREVAAHAAQRDVFLCIEPLDRSETDFITCSREGMDLVRRVGHVNFRLHLDAKAMMAAGEDYQAAIGPNIADLFHVHVADPGLAPPGSTGMDHRPIAHALKAAGYSRYISLEVRQGFGPSEDVIRRSVTFTRRC